MLAYSPLPKPASVIASWMACAQRGVEGECLSRMELPMIMGGMTDLNGSQKGKFHGMITNMSGRKEKIIMTEFMAHNLILTYLAWVQEASA